MAAVDYYNTSDDNVLNFGRDIKWLAQTFQASKSYDISSVKLLMYKAAGSSPGTVTVSIKAVSGGLPTGADLASGTTDGDTLTSTSPGEWREITFGSSYSLISGTTYAIVVRCSNSNISDYISWRCDATSPTYGNGQACQSIDTGSSWSALATIDMMFETYEGTETIDISGTITATSSLTGTLTVDTSINLTGTIAITSSLTGALTVSANWQTDSTKFYKRLIAIGNDSLYYEDL